MVNILQNIVSPAEHYYGSEECYDHSPYLDHYLFHLIIKIFQTLGQGFERGKLSYERRAVSGER